MNTVDIDLEHSITVDGEEVKTLTMRVPTVGDLIDHDTYRKKNNASADPRLFANLCGIPYEAIKPLAIKDYRKVEAAYEAFTTDSDDDDTASSE